MWAVGHPAGQTCLSSILSCEELILMLSHRSGMCFPREPVWWIIMTGKTNKLRGTWLLKRHVAEKSRIYTKPLREWAWHRLHGCLHGILSVWEHLDMHSTATSGRSYLLHSTNKMAPGQKLSEHLRGCEHAKPRWVWERETVSRVAKQQKVFKAVQYIERFVWGKGIAFYI